MPKIYTLGTKAIMASGYKKGKEERRRYDQEFAENVKNNKVSNSINAFNASINAYEAYKSKKNKKKKKGTVNTETGDYSGDTGNYSANDTDGDGLGEYFKSDLDDSSVSTNVKKKKKVY